MKEDIKFTVIIPTRERADTLLYALQTVVAQDYENLEIIVSDNFSQDNTKAVVESFTDSRIKYINTGRRLSMSHNWEFALDHVRDGWVTFVGDDDGLLPGALAKVAEVIHATNCKAVSSELCAFAWPGVWSHNTGFIVPLGRGYEIRETKKWLGKVLRGETRYQKLPWVYMGGFVDISAINAARKNGVFFLSSIPDVYSSIALSLTLSEYVYLKEPVVIAGASAHSTGASYFQANSNDSSVKKFFSEENIPFHSAVKNMKGVRSLALCIYEPYLQAAHLHNDHIKTRLEDQICIVLAQVYSDHYNDVEKYCCELALQHQLPFSKIKSKARVKKIKYIARSTGEYVYQFFRNIDLLPQQFGVKNIYDAAFVAKAVYLLESGSFRWRRHKISRIPQTFLRFWSRIR
ncbi:MAG: glycosyltransferase [Azonexus sp.]|jgi:glycosyltransferase involved in cell wall biosynthesis|nr:glycosyltransferase [Azonexus sp.]